MKTKIEVDRKQFYHSYSNDKISELCKEIKDKIKPLKIQNGLLIQPVLNFSNSVYRFALMSEKHNDISISVYLDAFNFLGLWKDLSGDSELYWEAYPIDGNNMRYDFEDTETLMLDCYNDIIRRVKIKELI